MEKNKEKDLEHKYLILLVTVLVILFVLIIYVATLGRVSSSEINPLPEEFKDANEIARLRHARLQTLIEKRETLKPKLQNRFRWIYFSVRSSLVAGWLGILYGLFANNLIDNLGDVLNYSEAGILLLLIAHFLTFGSISNLNSYIDLIKLKTENYVYGRYLNIDEKIVTNKIELAQIDNELIAQTVSENSQINIQAIDRHR
jgi:hypothetical protein